MVVSELQSTTFLFLEAFANVITKHSSYQNHWIARTGSYSIYALLSQIVPEVRTDTGVLSWWDSQLTRESFVCRALKCLQTAPMRGTHNMM
jgi:hypothetical protein